MVVLSERVLPVNHCLLFELYHGSLVCLQLFLICFMISSNFQVFLQFLRSHELLLDWVHCFFHQVHSTLHHGKIVTQEHIVVLISHNEAHRCQEQVYGPVEAKESTCDLGVTLFYGAELLLCRLVDDVVDQAEQQV